MATELVHYSDVEADGEKIIYRSHWNYQGRPWNDHAYIDYGPCVVLPGVTDTRPSRLLAFVKLEPHNIKEKDKDTYSVGWNIICTRTISPPFFHEMEHEQEIWFSS